MLTHNFRKSFLQRAKSTPNRLLHNRISMLVFVSIIFIFTFPVFAQQLYRVEVKLCVPELAAVQWSVLNDNPVVAFKKRVEENRVVYQSLLDRRPNQQERDASKSRLMAANWDRAFLAVTGFDIYMSTHSDMYGCNIAIDTVTRWVVTKVTKVKTNPICWAIPVKVQSGDTLIVELSKKNAFPLAQVFSEVMSSAPKENPAEVRSDPKAYGLYGGMIKAMEDAKTLYFESSYERCIEGEDLHQAIYKAWMKKPNYVRLEASCNNKIKGILVGDGYYFWTYWPNGRSKQGFEDPVEYARTCSTSYMKQPSKAYHSIDHQTPYLEAGMGQTVHQLSRFHKCLDAMDDYIDSVMIVGTETVNEEECDILEVSYCDYQRSKYYWLSKKDRLPRKLEEIFRLKRNETVREIWSNVTINLEIPDSIFFWQPPKYWQEWLNPEWRMQEDLLKPSTAAPDFSCATLDGNTFKLADYRGKVVLINFWRVGCPPCRDEIPNLNELFEKYKDNGLIVLGFNWVDKKQIALDLLVKYKVTYPNIIDTSDYAEKVSNECYKVNAVPTTYIIDKEGIIFDAWFGWSGTRIQRMLVELKIK